MLEGFETLLVCYIIKLGYEQIVCILVTCYEREDYLQTFKPLVQVFFT